MGMMGIATGCFVGLTTKLGTNMLQKVPLSRQPWEHVLLVVAGGIVGNYIEKNHHKNVEEVERIRLYLERRPDKSLKKE